MPRLPNRQLTRRGLLQTLAGKLTHVDPLAYITDVLTRIVGGHPNRQLDCFLPWTCRYG